MDQTEVFAQVRLAINKYIVDNPYTPPSDSTTYIYSVYDNIAHSFDDALVDFLVRNSYGRVLGYTFGIVTCYIESTYQLQTISAIRFPTLKAARKAVIALLHQGALSNLVHRSTFYSVEPAYNPFIDRKTTSHTEALFLASNNEACGVASEVVAYKKGYIVRPTFTAAREHDRNLKQLSKYYERSGLIPTQGFMTPDAKIIALLDQQAAHPTDAYMFIQSHFSWLFVRYAYAKQAEKEA